MIKGREHPSPACSLLPYCFGPYLQDTLGLEGLYLLLVYSQKASQDLYVILAQQGSRLGNTASRGRREGVGMVLGNPLPLLSANRVPTFFFRCDTREIFFADASKSTRFLRNM